MRVCGGVCGGEERWGRGRNVLSWGREWGDLCTRVSTFVHTHFLFRVRTFFIALQPVAQVGEFLRPSPNTGGLRRVGSPRMLQLCGRVSHEGAGGKRGKQ